MAAVEKALQLDPKHFAYYKTLDDLLSKRGEWQKIIALWTQFVALVPENGQAFCERGGAYLHLHDLPNTLKDYEKGCSLGYQKCCEYVKRIQSLYPGGTQLPSGDTAHKE